MRAIDEHVTEVEKSRGHIDFGMFHTFFESSKTDHKKLN